MGTSINRNEKVEKYTVYILECADGTLYTGITNNLEKRLAMHMSRKGSKYVAGKLPIKVVYKELWTGRSEASKREFEIKKLSREAKLLLINSK